MNIPMFRDGARVIWKNMGNQKGTLQRSYIDVDYITRQNVMHCGVSLDGHDYSAKIKESELIPEGWSDFNPDWLRHHEITDKDSLTVQFACLMQRYLDYSELDPLMRFILSQKQAILWKEK